MSRATPVGRPVAATGGTLPPLGPLVYAMPTTAVSVTPGTSNSDGAWVEIIATAPAASFIEIQVLATFWSGAATPVLLDVAFGAAGSEVVVVADVCVGQATSQRGVFALIPVRVPQGARVSARMVTSSAVAPAAQVRMSLWSAAAGALGMVAPRVVTMGGVHGSSVGRNITTNNTYTEVVSATAEPFQGLLLTMGGNDGSYASNAPSTTTLGVGPSGAEVAVAHHFHYPDTFEDIGSRFALPVAMHVPAGTRLAAKASNGASHSVTVSVLGFPYA